MYSQSLTTLALAATTALAAPTGLAPRDLVIQCGQYQQLSNGPYTLYTNGWSWSSGQGNQCSSIWSRDGSRLTWSTSWSWSGTPTQVKSYTNVETNIQKKQLSQYKSMPTYWTWDYTGTNIRANVAYDMFVGNSASGGQTFEVMVWLGLYGDISPLSSNGYPFKPIASVDVGNGHFDLAYGLNGNVKVYSFVAKTHMNKNFNGDLLDFYKFLEKNEAQNGFNGNLYLQSIQAGTEVFTGSNAKLTTNAYSTTVN